MIIDDRMMPGMASAAATTPTVVAAASSSSYTVPAAAQSAFFPFKFQKTQLILYLYLSKSRWIDRHVAVEQE